MATSFLEKRGRRDRKKRSIAKTGWIGTIIGVVGDVHNFGLAAPVGDEFLLSSEPSAALW